MRTAARDDERVRHEVVPPFDQVPTYRGRSLERALRGDVAIAARSENIPPSISDRVTGIMEGERFAIRHPTQTHLDAYAIAADEFTQQLAKLRTLIQVDEVKLEKDMEAAGAPWTPGRVPEWVDEKR